MPTPRTIARRPSLPLAIALLIAGLLTTIAIAWGTPLLNRYLRLNNTSPFDRELPPPGSTITTQPTNGWPLACFTSTQSITSTQRPGPSQSIFLLDIRRTHAFSIDIDHAPGDVETVYLAYRPLLLGLLANALLYSAAWLALYCLALSVRARRRARKHQCVKCTYDLQGSSTHCPECGHPLSASASA